MRICSLLPSATEIAFALGLGDQVVGVTHECDYPPEAKKRRVVVKSAIDPEKTTSGEIDRLVREHLQTKKSIYTLDLASFRAADPDFILTQDLCDVCAIDYNEVIDAARTLPRAPKIVALAPANLADVLGDIEAVGNAAGKKREAKEFVANLRRRIDSVRERAARAGTRPRVAVIEWLEPIYNAGHWVPEMVEIAGGLDGLGEKGKPSKRIEWESVRTLAPEVIVLMPCGFDVGRSLKEFALLSGRDGWNELPAIKTGRVYAVDGSAYFNRSGPRLVDGLDILAQIIHPEIFRWDAEPEAAQKI